MVPAGLTLAGVPFLADPSGALFHEGEGALLVADLHLEKGSSFARRGMLLPPYDTGETLLALATVVARYAPRLVIALGDSFHDPHAAARLSDADRGRIADLQRGRAWLWLTGNHDPLPHGGLDGDVAAEAAIGLLTLRHEPQPDCGTGEIAGHLHPVAKVLGTGGVARRRCFLADAKRCVMPAFGAYAGGLNIHHAAFTPLFGARPRLAHALGRDRIYAIPMSRCVADA
ncbi:ligase-associated DNA damage response endonuclease PdeM [Lichenihabitans sp. Uapishka_5]|uniref:ligase-associated DNA damage response endonuclease PdeM n=1 Tax=Lichenihabitans sp. Uapishka_5 TaxID=3037302 RepID=UPI0029E7FF80|nr:ligase-associated DNA damage response endonuclease PdeM [Lichenihabitans sp. Uapishka_5]MDX7951510.1 ligase-associated DNA damage response endonuclease PdeM [Lichenihabitans sp. Uapishka_5]